MLKTKKTSNPVKREDEPRFKADIEPTLKRAYRTMKSISWIWDGKDWELLSVRFGDVASDEIPLQIAKWLKSEEYKKLVNKK